MKPDPYLFSTKLLAWYRQQSRALPWRSETPDSYQVWLSEIMLQQTTVATAENRFLAFMRAFPTIEALAASTQAEVLQHWAGLGYYARARNLHHCAKALVAEYDGQFPQSQEALRKFAGIGAYTAAAIAAIAFDQPSVAVDSNVKRIFSRISRHQKPLRDNSPELLKFFSASQTQHSPRHHLQAWMDFGETLCRSRNPDCSHCPIQDMCMGADIATTLPIKNPKKPRHQLQGFAYYLTNDHGDLWLRRRPDKGLLAGMLEIPTSNWSEDIPSHCPSVPRLNWQITNQNITHRFTHIDLSLTILGGKADISLDIQSHGCDSAWHKHAHLDQVGLATLMMKIVGAMQGGRDAR